MSFADSGYHVERGLIDKPLIDDAIKDIHVLVKNQLHVNPSNLSLDMSILKETNQETYLSTLRLAGQLEIISSLVTHPVICIGCKELGIQMAAFQTQPVLHVMSEQLKIPGGYHGIGAHQDYSSTEASKNGIVVWIPLMDTEDNYPLEVIPGNHKWGLLPGKQKENYFEVKESALTAPWKKLNMKKGDVLFMSVFTVHRTCLEGNFRIAASIRYEDAMEPSFIERGYPCKYKRVYQP